jgi:hypothetical protein
VVRVPPSCTKKSRYFSHLERDHRLSIRSNKRTQRGPHESKNAVPNQHCTAPRAEARQKLPPFLEFLDRYRGTLPEIIGRADLIVLNAALSFLFAHLREARRLFDEKGDAGRLAAFTALGALVQFVLLFEKPNSETLHTPILRLQDALISLEKNSVLPIVTPTSRRGRGGSSQMHLALKGHVAGTIRRLVSVGVDQSDAQQKVAALLRRRGVRAERGPGQVTTGTVRNWCNEVSSDVGRKGTAALVYDDMFAECEERRFVTLSQAEARRFALECLSNWVQWQFPELRKAT